MSAHPLAHVASLDVEKERTKALLALALAAWKQQGRTRLTWDKAKRDAAAQAKDETNLAHYGWSQFNSKYENHAHNHNSYWPHPSVEHRLYRRETKDKEHYGNSFYYRVWQAGKDLINEAFYSPPTIKSHLLAFEFQLAGHGKTGSVLALFGKTHYLPNGTPNFVGFAFNAAHDKDSAHRERIIDWQRREQAEWLAAEGERRTRALAHEETYGLQVFGDIVSGRTGRHYLDDIADQVVSG